MVTCMNKERKYGSVISNGKVSVDCDNPTEYGGDGYVFGPHDFIEAGYAACLDVCARKICEADGIEFKKVIVTVALDYYDDKKTYIRHKIEVTGVPKEVSEDVAKRAYDDCLVKSNLSKELVFEPLGE